MYVVAIPNRGSPPAILIRESYREGGKVRSRTVANISRWSPEKIEALREVLAGSRKPSRPAARLEDTFEIVRSWPHGHVAAVLGTLRRLQLHEHVDRHRSAQRDLVEAMIVAHVLSLHVGLRTTFGSPSSPPASSLGRLLGLERVDEREVNETADWLLHRQQLIEDQLAHRHLGDGGMALLYVSTTFAEGRRTSGAEPGHPRSDRHGIPTDTFGLLTNAEGCPVAVRVLSGTIGGPNGWAAQVRDLCRRLHIERVVVVGDAGTLDVPRIHEELGRIVHLDWIAPLGDSAIRKLVKRRSLKLHSYKPNAVGEVSTVLYPGDRLIAHRSPRPHEQQHLRRLESLAAAEAALSKIVARTRRSERPLRGTGRIALEVGKVLGRHSAARILDVECHTRKLTYSRNEQGIATEQALDGLSVLRTSLTAEQMSIEEVVRKYQGLSQVEHAFGGTNALGLTELPTQDSKVDRGRARVLLSMLAYYLEWHMREALAPILLGDDAEETGELPRPLAPERGGRRGRARSLRSLLDDLAAIAIHRVQTRAAAEAEFHKLSKLTTFQARVFELLRVPPNCGLS
jgi:hypothetical protein